ncbi:hypothetical protein [Cesiribacter sp. SM1]|uniref:hypothetical protein n=1 Tax=Cesiribacter sp. SM1 TaxID=2861196 RepID=UPI001CD56E96|nr:hypothetical protein [Cesiribacter sp. SM1]
METNRELRLFVTLFVGGSAFLLVFIGVLFSFLDPELFREVYVQEDGFIENLTFLALLGISVLMFGRFLRLRNEKGKWFKLMLFLMGALALFGAGEEISWGQRILSTESPEFFLKHNAQGETNVHNMLVNEHKVNKIIFSKLLFIAVALYLLVFPLAYKRSAAFANVIDQLLGIPIPRAYQIGAFVGILLMTNVVTEGKGAELLEFGSCMVFLLIFLFPKNEAVYTSAKCQAAIEQEKKAAYVARRYVFNSTVKGV